MEGVYVGTHHVPPTVEGSWVKEGLCVGLLLPTHEGCYRGVQGWDPSRDPQGQQESLGAVVAWQGHLGVELLGYRLAGHQGQRGE